MLKIPVFELNIPFVFHRNCAEGIQSMLEFLKLIYEFLARSNTAEEPVYIFPVFRDFGEKLWPNGLHALLQTVCGGWERGFDSRAECGSKCRERKCCYKFKLKHCLAHFR